MGYAVTVLCKSLQIANVSSLTEDTDFDADSIQFLWEKKHSDVMFTMIPVFRTLILLYVSSVITSN